MIEATSTIAFTSPRSGGCTFCSITEHEGRIIQSRSEDSVLREIEAIRDKTPGFTGVISDICENLDTPHDKLIRLYRKVREAKGVRKVMVASGVRYDLAVRSPHTSRSWSLITSAAT